MSIEQIQGLADALAARLRRATRPGDGQRQASIARSLAAAMLVPTLET